MIQQYRAKVSWQSLNTWMPWLDPQSSKLKNFEYRVSSWELRVSSREFWVSRLETELSASLIFHAPYWRKDWRETISSPLHPSSNACEQWWLPSISRTLSIQTTLSQRIFKSPLWLIASSVTLSYELKRCNVARETTLLHGGDNSLHEYHSRTHVLQ